MSTARSIREGIKLLACSIICLGLMAASFGLLPATDAHREPPTVERKLNTLPAQFHTYEAAAERYWRTEITFIVLRGDPSICGLDVAAYVVPDEPDGIADQLPWTVFVCPYSWRLLTGEQQCWVAVHESGHKLGLHEHTRRGIMRPTVPIDVKLSVCQKYPPRERR